MEITDYGPYKKDDEAIRAFINSYDDYGWQKKKNVFYPGMGYDLFSILYIIPNVTTIYALDFIKPRPGYNIHMDEVKDYIRSQIQTGEDHYYNITRRIDNFDYGNISSEHDTGDVWYLDFTIGFDDDYKQFEQSYTLIYYHKHDFYDNWPKEIKNIEIVYNSAFGSYHPEVCMRYMERIDENAYLICGGFQATEIRYYLGRAIDPYPSFVGLGSDDSGMLSMGKMYPILQEIVRVTKDTSRDTKRLKLVKCSFCELLTNMMDPNTHLPFCSKLCREKFNNKIIGK